MEKKNNIQFLSRKNEEFDLRTNPFKERGDDMNPTTDHVHVPEGPITRSKVKKIQEAYTLHLQKLAIVPVETRTFVPKIFIAFAYQIKKIMEWLILESN